MVGATQKVESKPWGLVLIEGIIALLVGILIVVRPGLALAIIVQLLGLYWIVKGILSLVSILQNQSLWGWKIIVGILGIFAGFIVIQNPLWSTLLVTSTLVVIVGISSIVMGIVEIGEGIAGGGPGPVILGVLSVGLGIVLLFNTVISAVVLFWLIGIIAIVGGIAGIAQAFRQRSLQFQAGRTRSGESPA